MLRKLYTYNYLWLIIYLWVIITLPLHHHADTPPLTNIEQCQHSHHHDNKSSQKDNTDCVICFNIQVPSATHQFPWFDYKVLNIASIPSYDEAILVIWQNTALLLNSNKDPPFSIIS